MANSSTDSKTGICSPAGYNGKPPDASALKAPTKHWPSTTALVPKGAGAGQRTEYKSNLSKGPRNSDGIVSTKK
jgi:hypothetical protein